jgi:DtxR family manganese transport transcriptional regulator
MELAADYVELIEDLTHEFGEARAADLATRMGVSHVTVSKTLQRLVRDGFVTYRPYRSIFLTETGKELARAARERHHLLLRFLEWLGLPPIICEQDAEGMEHHISEETLCALRARLDQVAPESGAR